MVVKTSKNDSAKASCAKASKSKSKSSSSSGGPQRVLDICLFLEKKSGGNRDIPRNKVALMAGVKSNTFPVTISNMKKKVRERSQSSGRI